VQLGNVALNPEQRRAVAAFVTLGGGGPPVAIFGPPGTGKTVTLVEAALQALAADDDSPLLLCAPQNFACDTLCERLLDAGVAASAMLRLMDPRLPPNQVVCCPGRI
jgi:Rad3-related DNA helicase